MWRQKTTSAFVALIATANQLISIVQMASQLAHWHIFTHKTVLCKYLNEKQPRIATVSPIQHRRLNLFLPAKSAISAFFEASIAKVMHNFGEGMQCIISFKAILNESSQRTLIISSLLNYLQFLLLGKVKNCKTLCVIIYLRIYKLYLLKHLDLWASNVWPLHRFTYCENLLASFKTKKGNRFHDRKPQSQFL